VGSDLLFDLALGRFPAAPGLGADNPPQPKKPTLLCLRRHAGRCAPHRQSIEGRPGSGIQDLGTRLDEDLTAERLVFATDPFWTTSLMFRQMSVGLRKELASAGLVLVKGDVNYRRLLDDRHWPHTTRMEDVCAYFPAPFVALRTLKGRSWSGWRLGKPITPSRRPRLDDQWKKGRDPVGDSLRIRPCSAQRAGSEANDERPAFYIMQWSAIDLLEN